IPSRWAREMEATEAIEDLETLHVETPGLLNGYIHSLEEYEELFDACLDRNLRLVNSPRDYGVAHSLELAYPDLEGMTPATVFIDSQEQVAAAIEKMGLPAFIKGAVQSQKDKGWDACVAKTLAEAQTIVGDLLGKYQLSMGSVAIRRFIELRHSTTVRDFPAAREFRISVFQNRALGFSRYWPECDAWQDLTADEQQTIIQLAEEASRRVKVPLLVIDVAQLTNGEWIVVEIGDLQSAGLMDTDREDLARGILNVCKK
ncbi:MAG: ATP-grasp domain-containing protein, partial [Verrucomicrobiota bacterium]